MSAPRSLLSSGVLGLLLIAACLGFDTVGARAPEAVAATSASSAVTLDLAYGRTRGRVHVSVRARGSRADASFRVTHLRLPALDHGRRARFEFAASSLCGGRLGAWRSVASKAFRGPVRDAGLVARMSVPARCPASRPLGVFFQVRLVLVRPRLVVHTVRGSVASVRKEAGNASR